MVDRALFAQLGQNVLILLSAVWVYSLVSRRTSGLSVGARRLASGIAFGGLAILGMHMPMRVAAGVMVDSRVVLVALAGVLEGWPAALAATTLVAGYRLHLGGVGAIAGVGAIITGALLGLWAGYRWPPRKGRMDLGHVAALGLLLAAAGLAWGAALASAGRWTMVAKMAPPVLFYYPLATVLFAVAFWQQVRQERADETIRRDAERSRRLLALHAQAPQLRDADLYDAALLSALELTSSESGCLHFVSDDQQTVTLAAWRGRQVTEGQSAADAEHAGAKACNCSECLRSHGSVVHNDRTSGSLADGHAPARRYVSTPVVEGEVVRMVLGVRNKADDYDEQDVTHLRLVAGELQRIVARRRAEEALSATRSQAAFLAEVLHRSSQPFVVGLPDGELVLLNDAFADLTGYSRDELHRLNWATDLTPPEWVATEQTKLAELVRTGQAVRYEKEYVRRDGSRVPVGLHVDLVRDQLGRAETYCAFVTDLTERHQAEQALREREELLRTVLRAAPVGIALISDKTVRSANARLADLLGYREDELVGRPGPGFFESPEANDAAREVLLAQLSQGEIATVVTRLRRSDGALLDVVMSAAAFDADHPDGGAVVGIQDVTALRHAEESRAQLQEQLNQAQKMESIGRLAGGVAHDFNNVLQVIMANGEALADGLAPEHVCQNNVAEVLSATQRAASLTRQLLTFARKQAVQPRVVDLNQAVGEMEKMLRRLIGERIALSWRPVDDDCRVTIDPSQFDQVLANLVVNARDAIAGHGAIALEASICLVDAEVVGAEGELPQGEYVVLSVSDTGCGMDRETMARIFEPFFTTKELGQGTGLGLATVHGIVHQQGGFVRVYSEPGHGTTFRVYLPRSVGTAEPEARATEAQQRGHGQTVLVVDDDPALLKACRQTLARLGYDVLAASGGAEALVIAEQHDGPIALLLTDVMMPEVNGPQLAERLALVRPDTQWLFMSGYAEELLPAGGGQREGYEVLTKPFTTAQLADKLQELLGAG